MQIYRLLGFRMNPVTPVAWVNWFMAQWDLFITDKNFIKIHFKR